MEGVNQKPIEGVSMLSTPSTAPRRASGTRRSTSRCAATAASRPKGWTAVTRHKTPLDPHRQEDPGLRRSCLQELYDTNVDWTERQANDLAKQMPGKLHEPQRLWLMEAMRYDVLPLDDVSGSSG